MALGYTDTHDTVYWVTPLFQWFDKVSEPGVCSLKIIGMLRIILMTILETDLGMFHYHVLVEKSQLGATLQ